MLEEKKYSVTPTGRFNIFSYRVGLWNVIFVPFGTPNATIIVRNLTRDEAMDLMDTFNEAINAVKDDNSDD